ncbi:MAG TPA: TIM barrel protein [Dermatophilaceae bacterium]|nr:TIM barrel protein [Dermatophilaceae bacterium]
MIMAIKIGTAPDSWGVWFADDPQQVPWQRFLDEAAAAGYRRIELGPYGYLPTDPARLRDELAARDLELVAGTIFTHLHRPDSWDSSWEGVAKVAELTRAMGGRHVVVIPAFWRDDKTGEVIDTPTLDEQAWDRLGRQTDELGRRIAEEYGLRIQFHPHADTHVDTHEHVEKFLAMTDPEHVTLCLDTGHISYCNGDNLKLIQDYPQRIGYVHLKQVDPAVVHKAHEEGLGFGEAVRLGAMIEPPLGVPDMPPILDALARLDVEILAIVEQDMYPCEPDTPGPIAARTFRYLTTCGGGPVT